MFERHTMVASKSDTRRAVLSAAALFCLAGSSTAMGQQGAPPVPPPMPAQPGMAQPALAQPASGKAITQAGGLRNPLENQASAGGDKVKVDEHMIVDLHVNDEDLANVLQMLSIQSQKNIVSSRNVSAVVTANLYGVTFYEALDAILHVNGYGYMEKGNFIYVYTLEELVKIQEAGRQMVWKVIKLNYLSATDAAEFVKPLLSEKGQIKTNGKAPNFTISATAPGGDESFANESTMLVFDYEENLAEIEKVVTELDTRPAQVLIEATILQTALTEANAFGVDFSIIGDLDFSDFTLLGGPLKAVDGLLGGSSQPDGAGDPLPADGRGGAVVSTPGNTAGPSTMKLGLVYNDVSAFVRLLDEVADTTIISRPNILTLNRQAAHVLVGRKVGYLNTTSTDTATTQTVEFLDTGTQLAIRPFVAGDGMIRMELKPKVSEAVIRNVTNSGGAAVTIPDEISNELTTNVNVRDGQTIVLGGLFREETTSTRRQVPGLGDIPLVGAAFRGHDDSTNRSEIIFMITPTIVSDTVLLEQGKRGEAAVERVRAGSREGLLPWSREKRTQQLIVQATEMMRQGKREQALYKVQRALSLNHNQPDAIALREELLNTKANWPNRSIYHGISTGEFRGKSSNVSTGKGDPMANKTPAPASRPLVEVGVSPIGQTGTDSTSFTVVEEPAFEDPMFNDPGFTGEPNGEPAAEPFEPGAVEPQGNPEQTAASAPAAPTGPTASASKTPAPAAPASKTSFGFRSVWGLFRSPSSGLSSVPTDGK